ncbi:MAG: prephenate dehydrogenase, partial [Sediminibacterium sp.]|nr:prephenate dehydrogenase [Sediminibacterium sp.]
MNITIIGVGLIGGSIALTLKEKNTSFKFIGVDNNKNHQKQALNLQIVEAFLPLHAAIKKADYIILATPVNVSKILLPKILNRISFNQFIMDVGSIKAGLIDLVKNHPKRSCFIATHPMWGTEFSGPTAALKNKFKNKKTIICDAEHSNLKGLQITQLIYKKLGMDIIYMNSNEHDIHVAYISHISHITSFALANTVLEKEKDIKTIFNLASTGFESTVRLAKSNPNTWVPILLENRKNILIVLKEHIRQLKLYEKNLQSFDKNGLTNLI